MFCPVYFQPLQTEPVDLSVKKSSPSHWYDEMGEPESEAAANLRLGFRGLSYIKKGKSQTRHLKDNQSITDTYRSLSVSVVTSA